MTRIHFEKTKAHANGLMWEWLTFHLPLFAFAPPPTPPLKPTQEKKKKLNMAGEENSFLSRRLEAELCSLASGPSSDSKWLFLED